MAPIVDKSCSKSPSPTHALTHTHPIINQSNTQQPQVRAQIESQCTLIAKGQAAIASVVEHSLRNFEAKYRYFTASIDVRVSFFVCRVLRCV